MALALLFLLFAWLVIGQKLFVWLAIWGVMFALWGLSRWALRRGRGAVLTVFCRRLDGGGGGGGAFGALTFPSFLAGARKRRRNPKHGRCSL